MFGYDFAWIYACGEPSMTLVMDYKKTAVMSDISSQSVWAATVADLVGIAASATLI